MASSGGAAVYSTISDRWAEQDPEPRGSIFEVPKGYSMLKQYAEDWGYGGKLGFIHNRRKHPECSWEVPMAVNDLYTQFSMGKAPVKPLSPQELKDALHVGRTQEGAAARESIPDEEFDLATDQFTQARENIRDSLRLDEEDEAPVQRGGAVQPDSLNVSAIEEVNESASRPRPTARQVLAKGFSPSVAEGLSHARGRESLGHDPTGRLSYGGIRREAVGGGGGGGTPDPIATGGTWLPAGEQVGLYTTRANKVYPVYREADGKLYYPNYWGKRQEIPDVRHVAPLENEWGDADDIVGSYKVRHGVDKDEVVVVYKEKGSGKTFRYEGKHGGKRIEVKSYNPPDPYARP